MGQPEEAVARSFVECLNANDQTGAINLYADDVVYHVTPGREPLVGKEAIRSAFAGSRWISCKVVNMASTDGVVFIEGIDTIHRDGLEFTIHHCFILEIDQDGLITAERDYWDTRERSNAADSEDLILRAN